MNLRKRLLAVTFLTITGLAGLTAPALAAPMPFLGSFFVLRVWRVSKATRVSM